MKISERQIAEGILYTDQYQLTMAQLYYRMGLHEKQAQFDHFFRDYPDYGTDSIGPDTVSTLEWSGCWIGCLKRISKTTTLCN